MVSTKEDLKNIIALEEKEYGRSSLIRRYLRELRICEYYKNCGGAQHDSYLNSIIFIEIGWGCD